MARYEVTPPEVKEVVSGSVVSELRPGLKVKYMRFLSYRTQHRIVDDPTTRLLHDVDQSNK